jgi:Protein of unknown function (DUF3276).
VRFGNRTYFFDVKLADNGKNFLRITESKFFGEGKDRQYNSFILFPENVTEFQKTLKKAELSLGLSR